MANAVEISVVIPVYNNASALQELTDRLLVTLKQCAQEFEIIYVNDGSRDKSLALLKELAAKVAAVKVINLSRNFGQHPAICAGFEHASGEVTILMDADLQDKPEDIIDLINKLQADKTDIVYTIKKSMSKKLTSRLTSVLYHYVFSRLTKFDVPVNIGTMRAFNQKFRQAVLQFKEVNVLYGPLMFYMGFRHSLLELQYQDRPDGASSYTFKKRLQLAFNSLMSYTDLPHRLSMALGVTLLASSFFYSIAIAVQYLFFGSLLPEGSTLIVLMLSLTLGSLMLTLGVIGSYIFRVYQEVLHRPRYLIQETLNLSSSKSL
jgi:polyisoprenyl-phosphate glycosyltransferase